MKNAESANTRAGRVTMLGVLVLGTLMALLVGPTTPARAERVGALQLLPDSTVVLLYASDLPELGRRFGNTALGRMSADPGLAPLVSRLSEELAAMVNDSQERIGLDFSQLVGLAQGELALALVAQEDKPPALVVLLDVGSHAEDARTLLDHLDQELDRGGARKSTQRIQGASLRVYENVGSRQGRLAVLLHEETILVGNDEQLVRRLVEDWERGAENALADDPRVRSIRQRFERVAREEPQVMVYVDPIGLWRAASQDNPALQLSLAMLPALGLDGVKAAGGCLGMDCALYDSVLDLHLLIEPPRAGVLNAIALEGGPVEPERWVPAETMTYTTLRWNFQESFEAARTVFDAFRGEGALSRAVARPLEPAGIDFEKDLLPELEGRVTLLGWSDPGAGDGPPRPRRVLGLKVRDARRVGELLAQVQSRNADSVEQVSYSGKSFYQVRVAAPPRGAEPGASSAQPPGDRPTEADQSQQGTPPRPCFGVLDDYLVMCGDRPVYEKLILAMRSGERLGEQLEFKLVLSRACRLAGTDEPVWFSFRRPELQMRTLYEWIGSEGFRQRAANLAESNRFWKAIHGALEDYELPPFETVSHYFAPGGAVVVDDDSGLHYYSFTLRRKRQED